MKIKPYSINKTRENKTVIYTVSINSDFSLFRYRNINDYTINAFKNDEIFGSCPSTFNDPYDSILSYNTNKLFKHISDKYKQINFPKDQIKEMSERFVTEVFSNRNVQDVFAIASLSVDINNETMWAHYASNAKGFALEYSYCDLKCTINAHNQATIEMTKEFLQNIDINLHTFDGYEIEKSIAPVIYEDVKNFVTNNMIEIIDYTFESMNKNITIKLFLENISLDISGSADYRKLLSNSLFLKKKLWQYEKEWRLIGYNNNFLLANQSKFVKFGKLKPKAIYLGEFINEYDEIALIVMSKQKQIPIYKMKSIYNGNKVYLRPIKINNSM